MIRVPLAVAFVVLLVVACHHAPQAESGGSVKTVAAVAAPRMPAGVTPALIALGDSMFSVRACQRCHGPKGTNGPNGPDLTMGPWLHGGRDYANLVRIITDGVPRDSLKETTRRFAMNPRGGGPVLLTDEQVKALAAFVWSISGGKTKP